MITQRRSITCVYFWLFQWVQYDYKYSYPTIFVTAMDSKTPLIRISPLIPLIPTKLMYVKAILLIDNAPDSLKQQRTWRQNRKQWTVKLWQEVTEIKMVTKMSLHFYVLRNTVSFVESYCNTFYFKCIIIVIIIKQ